MMFLTEFHGSDATRLTAAADAVFAALVDVDRLPEWNARIHHVIESPAPASPVAEGTEWVVQMRASGGRWPSRSRALVVDPAAGRFEYETRTDDGNPSAALWSWHVTPAGAGCELTVTWAVYPRTWGRRLLGARIRRPALITEVRTSLAGLDAHIQPGKAGRVEITEVRVFSKHSFGVDSSIGRPIAESPRRHVGGRTGRSGLPASRGPACPRR